LGGNVDWVFSGINYGANLGLDLFASGTVAAAREASFMACRALAISHLVHPAVDIDWRWIRLTARRLVDFVLAQDVSSGCFWNLNMPLFGGKAECPMSSCPVDANPIPLALEAVEQDFICTADYHSRTYKKGTDVDLCFHGHATVSKVTF
jgi:5'-nucleotidase